jgi:hypothetical protein
MICTKLTEKYYLVKKTIEQANEKQSSVTNHICLFDRSGSMSGNIKELGKEMKQFIRSINIDDTITLMWFSGPNQKGTIIKGFKITDDKDFSIVDKAVDENCTVIGTTCFSESLIELEQIMKDLNYYSTNFTFTLFTDGYPVVNNINKEIAVVNSSLEKLPGKNIATLFVGYGEYYNKEFMTQMSLKAGGSLLHSNDLKEWGYNMSHFLTNVNCKKTKIEIEKDNINTNEIKAMFSINNGNILTYNVDKIIHVQGENLYVICEQEHGIIIDKEILLDGMYAASYVLIQQCNTDIALDILGNLGDKYLVDKCTNAYTNSEYGSAEKDILNAVVEPTKRYLKGKVDNCVPKDDAFCLLELLEILIEDKDAYFFPRHPEFKYKRIGCQKEIDDKYPKFEASADVPVSFSKLVWNNSKLNLSVLAHIKGKIKLSPISFDNVNITPEELGLSEYYDTFIYRNYTLIKDGTLNISMLPMRCGATVYALLKQNNLIINPNAEDGIYIIDLSALPIINRNIVRNNNSATELAKVLMRKLQLDCHMKVLKSKVNEINNKIIINDRVKEFLLAHGVKDGCFNPPVLSNKDKEYDFYMAKVFNAKIKGASTLPKVSDITGKKKLNLPGQFMKEVIDIKDEDVGQMIVDTKKELNKAVSIIQRNKFALILCKKWFDEFKHRNDCVINIKDKVGTVNVNTSIEFSIDEIKVEFD